MLKTQLPLKVKPICAFIYNSETNYKRARQTLTQKLGPLDFESAPIRFDFTDYYTKEMGKNLRRQFVSFKRLRDPASFIKIKLLCIKLEKRFAQNNQRTVNLDPGYLNEAKLVLTTTKDFSHRIYLGQGIFAEVTLKFQDGQFCHCPTTFPDYRSRQYKEIFLKIRDLYRKQLRPPK